MSIAALLAVLMLGGEVAGENYSVGGDRTSTTRQIISKLIMGGLPRSAKPEEIKIYISEEHKAVVAALLDAVDKGTSVTRIADFDALSSTYGLIGIHLNRRVSSDFHEYSFRLTFPPASDVTAIAEAYWNLPYVKGDDSGWIVRVTDGLMVGALIGGLVYMFYHISASACCSE